MSIFRRLASGGDKAPSPTSVDSDNPIKFTLPHLRNLHKVLVENKIVTVDNESLVVEVLRVLAEMVVYGDSKSELLFDFFCEKNMLSLFLEIMRCDSCPGKVYVQILQTLSILCQCVRNDTSLYYLLSNNYINDIIRFPYDFEAEELSDIFLSFMKSLSLRLNKQTVQFFFIEDTSTFPLLSRSIEFLKYRDPMVRTGAQSTILNIFKIQEGKARKYSLDDNILATFAAEVTGQLEAHYNSIMELAVEYATYIAQPQAKGFTEGKMGEKIENQMSSSVDALEDWLYYLEDIFGLKIPKLTNLLSEKITTNYVYAVLLRPLLRRNQWARSALFTGHPVGPSCAAKSRVSSKAGATVNSKDDFASSSSTTAAMEAAERGNPDLLTISDMLRGGAVAEDDGSVEGFQDESAVGLVVSLYLLMQIFRNVREKRLCRSVTVALFHPSSRQHRLEFLRVSRGDREGDLLPALSEANIQPGVTNDQTGELIENDRKLSSQSDSSFNHINPYRCAIVDLLGSGKDRYTLMGCLLIESCIRPEIKSCSSFLQTTSASADATDATSSVLEVLEMLKIWDVDVSDRAAKPDVEIEEMLASLRLSAAASEEAAGGSGTIGGSSNVHRTGNDLMEDMNAEGNGESDMGQGAGIENGHPSNGRVSSTDESHRDYKAEMDKYTYGTAETEQVATRGRGGSADLLEDQLAGSLHPDSMAMSDLRALDLRDAESDTALPVPTNFSGGIMDGLFLILKNAATHSLAVLQTAVVLIYDMCRLCHRSSRRESNWKCPKAVIVCLKQVREATKMSAAALLERANGWLSDTLLSQLEEELRRAAASNPTWESTLKKVSSDILLLLPPTSHLFQRIGTDHSIPISEVEKARREIQIFLLLRALYMCILKLAVSAATASTSDDIAKCVVDSSLSQFGEYSDVPDDFTVGKTIAMGGRHCFASCVLLPVFDPAEFAKTGSIVNLHIAPPSDRSSPAVGRRGSSTPSSRSPMKQSSMARRLSLTPPAPVVTADDAVFKTPERPRKVGEVYFIYDELKTLLLSVPFKRLDSGVVLLAVPIHRIDVATDSEDERNIKLLMRSTQNLPTMDRVALSDASGNTGSYSPNAAHGDLGPKIASILPIRCPGVLYQMVIGFESKKHCDAAVKHIETCRMRVKSTRMDLLRSILQKWAVGESINPDS